MEDYEDPKASDDEEDQIVQETYVFTVSPKQPPVYSKILVSCSLLSSCYCLSLFPESSKIGQVTCKVFYNSICTTIQVATFYLLNSVLFIRPSEKLRPEHCLEFFEFLRGEHWLEHEVVLLDTISDSKFVGNPANGKKWLGVNSLHSNAEWTPLETGNHLEGISAAALLIAKASGLSASCYLGVTTGFEACEENLRVFAEIGNLFGLHADIKKGIYRIEQERHRHQIYS